MIKNQILDLKTIFKIYLKILKIKYFKFSNKLLFSKNKRAIFKNYFLK